MPNFTIYHNPRCSKSRQTLELLRQHQIEPEIVEYLKTPPSVAELTSVLTKLNLEPQDIMRKKEAEYNSAGLDNTELSQQEQLKRMTENPKVIERPIVFTETHAVIGRPPENVLELIK